MKLFIVVLSLLFTACDFNKDEKIAVEITLMQTNIEIIVLLNNNSEKAIYTKNFGNNPDNKQYYIEKFINNKWEITDDIKLSTRMSPVEPISEIEKEIGLRYSLGYSKRTKFKYRITFILYKNKSASQEISHNETRSKEFSIGDLGELLQ